MLCPICGNPTHNGRCEQCHSSAVPRTSPSDGHDLTSIPRASTGEGWTTATFSAETATRQDIDVPAPKAPPTTPPAAPPIPAPSRRPRSGVLLSIVSAVLLLVSLLAAWYTWSNLAQHASVESALRQETADLATQRNQLEAERDKLLAQREQVTSERDRLLARVAEFERQGAASNAAAAAKPATTVNADETGGPGRESETVRGAIRAAALVRTERGSGTTFKYRERGTDSIYVTNAHVVNGATQLSIVTLDGKTHAARLLGKDDAADLAVLAVAGQAAIPALRLGDSSALHPGDAMFVVGFALGTDLIGDPSVTRGVLSGRRTIGAVDFLQTDAAMNPGNSGGPVVNAAGELVGVATAGIRDRGGVIQGINFAIPSNAVRDVVERLAR